MAEILMGYGITNANGVAKLDYDANGNTLSHSYTGRGVGELGIVAKNSIIQSERFVITDAIYYDDMSSDTTSNYYLNTVNNSITYTDGYIVITSKNTGTEQYVDLRSLNDAIKGKTVNFEVEVDLNGMTGLVLRTYGISPVRSVALQNGVNVLEDVVVPSDSDSALFRITKTNSTSGQSFKFKNVKIYPV